MLEEKSVTRHTAKGSIDFRYRNLKWNLQQVLEMNNYQGKNLGDNYLRSFPSVPSHLTILCAIQPHPFSCRMTFIASKTF